MKLALFGLTCMAIGAGGAWCYAQYRTIRTFYDVTTFLYRRRSP